MHLPQITRRIWSRAAWTASVSAGAHHGANLHVATLRGGGKARQRTDFVGCQYFRQSRCSSPQGDLDSYPRLWKPISEVLESWRTLVLRERQ